MTRLSNRRILQQIERTAADSSSSSDPAGEGSIFSPSASFFIVIFVLLAGSLCCLMSMNCRKKANGRQRPLMFGRENDIRERHRRGEAIRRYQYEDPIPVVYPTFTNIVDIIPATLATQQSRRGISVRRSRRQTPQASARIVTYGERAHSIWANDNSTEPIFSLLNNFLIFLEDLSENSAPCPCMDNVRNYIEFLIIPFKALISMEETAFDIHLLMLLKEFQEHVNDTFEPFLGVHSCEEFEHLLQQNQHKQRFVNLHEKFNGTVYFLQSLVQLQSTQMDMQLEDIHSKSKETLDLMVVPGSIQCV